MNDQEFRDKVISDLAELKTDVTWLKDHRTSNDNLRNFITSGVIASAISLLLSGVHH